MNYAWHNGDSGIYVTKSADSTINSNMIKYSGNAGLNVFKSNNLQLLGNTIDYSDESGILIEGSTGCTVEGNGDSYNAAALELIDSTGNTFSNNGFDNDIDVIFDNSPSNTWSVDGVGNLWYNPSGTGFSQTAPNDNPYDTFCDIPYVLDSTNTDYHPLVMISPNYEI
jgi:parallel beta-helix repeat protein